MDSCASTPGVYEPQTWFVVFSPKTSFPWLSRLIPGHYKHVSAFAYYPGFKGWLYYNVHLGGTGVPMMSQEFAKAWLRDRLAEGCFVVKMERRVEEPKFRLRFFFWCTPAIKHLLGLRCWSVQPDAVLAACLAAGGERIKTD